MVSSTRVTSAAIRFRGSNTQIGRFTNKVLGPHPRHERQPGPGPTSVIVTITENESGCYEQRTAGGRQNRLQVGGLKGPVSERLRAVHRQATANPQ